MILMTRDGSEISATRQITLKFAGKFTKVKQAHQRANLRLSVDYLALLLACVYHPDVELSDLFALGSLGETTNA